VEKLKIGFMNSVYVCVAVAVVVVVWSFQSVDTEFVDLIFMCEVFVRITYIVCIPFFFFLL
jgi:hypothetical protein